MCYTYTFDNLAIYFWVCDYHETDAEAVSRSEADRSTTTMTEAVTTMMTTVVVVLVTRGGSMTVKPTGTRRPATREILTTVVTRVMMTTQYLSLTTPRATTRTRIAERLDA